MTFSTELVIQFAAMLIGAGAVYGGIRADIRAMHERIDAVRNLADMAHQRITDHLEKRK
jgi:hypothetical protein